MFEFTKVAESLVSRLGFNLFSELFKEWRKYIRFSRDPITKKIGYYCPSTLSYYRHGPLCGEEVDLIVRRILTVRVADSNRDILVQYPVFTTGGMNASYSLSDPERMTVLDRGENSGYAKLNISKGKVGSQHLVASESNRTSYPWKKSNRPSAENVVINSLLEKRITSDDRDFSGTRIVAKTSHVRLIVEFDKEFCPSAVHPIQISQDGEILRDERSHDFVLLKPEESKRKSQIFVLDLENPDPLSGVYLWWTWPEKPENS